MAVASSGFQQEFFDTTSQTLRTLYGSSLSWALSNRYAIPDPSFALSRELNAYELIRRDTLCAHLMAQRKHAVAGTETTCAAARDGFPLDEVAARLGETMLDGIENLDSAKLNAAEAVFRGQAFAQIVGERRTETWVDGIPRSWWVPTRLRDIDKRRFRYVSPEGDHTAPPILEMSDVSRGGSATWKPVEHPEWLMIHAYDDSESTLGYGRGLIDAMYVSWYARSKLLVEMLQAAERFGQGLVTVEVDPNRKGSTGQTNEAMLEAAASNVLKTKARHVIAHLTGEKVSLLEGTATGHQIIMAGIELVTNELTQLVLGSILPSGGGGDVGSNARAEVEQGTSDGLIRFDRKILAATLTRDVMGLFWRLNRPNLIGCGLALAKMPLVELSHEARETPERFAELLKGATEAGMDVSAKEAYTRLGLSMPKPGEPVVKKAAPVMAPGFGPGGGGFGQDAPKPPDAPPARSEPTAAEFTADVSRLVLDMSKAAEDRTERGISEVRAAVATFADAANSQSPSQAPTINVSVELPKDAIRIEAARAPDVTVNIPKDAIVVNVESPEPAVVNVNVPAQPEPVVNITVPAITVPPATVEVNAAPAQKSGKRVLKVTERDAAGRATKIVSEEISNG